MRYGDKIIIFSQPISTPISALTRRRVVLIPLSPSGIQNTSPPTARSRSRLRSDRRLIASSSNTSRTRQPRRAALSSASNKVGSGQPRYRRFDGPLGAIQLGDDGRRNIREMRLDVHEEWSPDNGTKILTKSLDSGERPC